MPSKISYFFTVVAFALTLPLSSSFAFDLLGQDQSEMVTQAQKLFLYGKYKESLALGRKAFAQGDADGALIIASFYEIGCSVPKDWAESDKWYRKAAKMGSVRAKQQIEIYQSDDGKALRRLATAMLGELAGC